MHNYSLMSENSRTINNLALHLGFLTNRVGRLMGIHLKNELGEKDFDLPNHCLGILADLWVQDGIIQQDLAISIVKDKATIARALNLMEKKNIIVRIKDEKDKRNKKIFLTYKGNQLQGKVLFHGDKVLNELKKIVAPEEMDICLNVLDKIYHSLRDKL